MRFGSIEDRRTFCRSYFQWYNHQRQHSGIEVITPVFAHEGRDAGIYIARHAVLDRAFQADPECF